MISTASGLTFHRYERNTGRTLYDHNGLCILDDGIFASLQESSWRATVSRVYACHAVCISTKLSAVTRFITRSSRNEFEYDSPEPRDPSETNCLLHGI